MKESQTDLLNLYLEQLTWLLLSKCLQAFIRHIQKNLKRCTLFYLRAFLFSFSQTFFCIWCVRRMLDKKWTSINTKIHKEKLSFFCLFQNNTESMDFYLNLFSTWHGLAHFKRLRTLCFKICVIFAKFLIVSGSFYES